MLRCQALSPLSMQSMAVVGGLFVLAQCNIGRTVLGCPFLAILCSSPARNVIPCVFYSTIHVAVFTVTLSTFCLPEFEIKLFYEVLLDILLFPHFPRRPYKFFYIPFTKSFLFTPSSLTHSTRLNCLQQSAAYLSLMFAPVLAFSHPRQKCLSVCSVHNQLPCTLSRSTAI